MENPVIRYFVNKKKEYEKFCVAIGSRRAALRERNIAIASYGKEVYDKLRRMMLINYGKVERVKNDVSVSDIGYFLDGCRGVDDGERSLLVEMFSHEGESGFVSADRDALNASELGLCEFGLSGSIYDARYSTVKRIEGKKVYNCA